jgi:lysozyme
VIQRKHVAWVSICIACVGAEEGLRTVAYQDAVGIWTGCYGETKGIHPEDRWTVEQCKEKLGTRVEEFGRGVDRCVTVPIPATRKAAYTSLAYNVGVEAFCKSSIVRKANAGDAEGSCDAMLLYVYAKGIKLPGLVKRRQKERELCLA